MAFLILDRLTFTMGDWGLCASLRVGRGECAALIGASGAGKSTLLSLIAGFETPDSGAVLVDNQDIGALAPAQRPVTMMFQEHNLFAHLSLYDNIALGCHPGLKLTPADHETINQALEATQLGDISRRRPAGVSGGERQRAALARCLCQKRPLLLLDEPFANLDPRLRQQMHALVDELRQTHALTVIVVSHLPHEAARIADRMVFMHEGQITEQGSASITLANPQSPELRDYLQFTPSG
ncbi:MAG: thiamine ABC transporter ATP-binding protein [Arenicellales bacterium]|jgi:thiamine transport system ATP-binding protein